MPHPGVTAEDYPKRAAIVMGGSGEVVTYRQLEERSNRGAHLFRSLGLQPGDHICMMMENSAQFLEIVWAAQRSGLAFTPIGTHIGKYEAAHILEDCDARLFIASGTFADTAEAILREPGRVEHCYMIKGTLDMLILKVLSLEAMHGWGISERIQQHSAEALQVNQGSLYASLHRLTREGWIRSEWRTTENSRRARYYALTRAGERQLGVEQAHWGRLSGAVDAIMGLT